MTENEFLQGIYRVEAAFGRFEQTVRDELEKRYLSLQPYRWSEICADVIGRCKAAPRVAHFLEAATAVAARRRPGQAEKCGTCEGTGFRGTAYLRHRAYGTKFTAAIPCQDCNGQGRQRLGAQAEDFDTITEAEYYARPS